MDKEQLLAFFGAADEALERLNDDDRVGAHEAVAGLWDKLVGELGYVPDSQTGLTWRCDNCGSPVEDEVDLCSYCS